MILAHIRSLRQRHKLLLSFGMLVAIMLVLFLMLYSIMLDKTETMAVEANAAAHSLVRDRLEQRLEECENLAGSLRGYSDLTWLLTEDRDPDGEVISRVISLKKDLPNITMSNSELHGYYVCSPTGKFVLSNAFASLRPEHHYDAIYPIEGMDFEAWKALAGDLVRESVFLPSQEVFWQGERSDCFFYIVPVYSTYATKVIGRVVFMLRESTIMQSFTEDLAGHAGFACLMSDDGAVIAQVGDPGLFEQLENPVLLEDGTVSVDLGGRDVIVLKSSSDMGFSCLSIIEKKDISAGLRDVRSILFGGIGILLVVSVLFSLLFTHQNTRQLKDMLDNLNSMGYRFENENELTQLNNLILGQHSANEAYQQELTRRSRWEQSILFERMLDGRGVDPLMLTELESRLPGDSVMCAFFDITADDEGSMYAAQQRLVSGLEAASDRVPYYRILSENRVQTVYRNLPGVRVSDFFRSLAERAAVGGARVLCYVGPAVDAYTHLPVSARNAQREIMLHDPADGSDVILCGQSPETDIDGIYTLETERQLMHNCLQGDGEEAQALLGRIRHAANLNGVASQLTTQMLVTGLCNTMLKILNDLPGKPDSFQTEKIMSGTMEVMRSQSLGGLFDFAGRCVTVFTEHTGRVKSDNLVRRVGEINAYVQETFADPDLRLTLIAEHFNLTERYLSEFYKKNTGVNLSAYIEDVRMKKAQELLKDGLPVGEVAARVGYTNVNTFRRAYRRQFGVNPSDEMK